MIELSILRPGQARISPEESYLKNICQDSWWKCRECLTHSSIQNSVGFPCKILWDASDCQLFVFHPLRSLELNAQGVPSGSARKAALAQRVDSKLIFGIKATNPRVTERETQIGNQWRESCRERKNESISQAWNNKLLCHEYILTIRGSLTLITSCARPWPTTIYYSLFGMLNYPTAAGDSS